MINSIRPNLLSLSSNSRNPRDITGLKLVNQYAHQARGVYDVYQVEDVKAFTKKGSKELAKFAGEQSKYLVELEKEKYRAEVARTRRMLERRGISAVRDPAAEAEATRETAYSRCSSLHSPSPYSLTSLHGRVRTQRAVGAAEPRAYATRPQDGWERLLDPSTSLRGGEMYR